MNSEMLSLAWKRWPRACNRERIRWETGSGLSAMGETSL
jgi:hypothetical protein